MATRSIDGNNGDSSLVYTTDSGRVCFACRQPVAACVCKTLAQQAARPVGDGTLRVSRDSKGRGGKTVTVVRGLDLEPDALAVLGKRLRTACGAGGTARDGVLEVQGDHVERVIAWLRDQGHVVKRAGG